MLVKEQYLALPSLQKEKYINNVLKEILMLNKTGVTASDITKATYFGRSTIWHHMELLTAKGECLRLEVGDTYLYHLNEVVKPLKELQLKGGKLDSHYTFDLVRNMYGEYVRIQRRRESRTKTTHVRQGVIIPYNSFNNFIDTLNTIKELIDPNK